MWMAGASQRLQPGTDWAANLAADMNSRFDRTEIRWERCLDFQSVVRMPCKNTKIYVESRASAGSPIRNGCDWLLSCFHPRKRWPEFAVSGVKNPAPVVVGAADLD
jgi:hypothetical protein